jgi:hypothetical protein
MKFSPANSCIKMWSFSDISGANSIPMPAHPEDGDGALEKRYISTQLPA